MNSSTKKMYKKIADETDDMDSRNAILALLDEMEFLEYQISELEDEVSFHKENADDWENKYHSLYNQL